MTRSSLASPRTPILCRGASPTSLAWYDTHTRARAHTAFLHVRAALYAPACRRTVNVRRACTHTPTPTHTPPPALLQGLRVTVQTPKGDVLLNKNLERESRFAFTSTEGGEYVVCFATNSSRWFGGQQRKFRVDLKFEVGDSNIDFAQVAKKEHLDSLEVEVRAE